MHIVGTLHIEAAGAESALIARMEAELGRIEALSDDGIEALCTVIGGGSASEVSRKLGRFAMAAASPAAVLGRALASEPGEVARVQVDVLDDELGDGDQ